jgi:hypothetical protein
MYGFSYRKMVDRQLHIAYRHMHYSVRRKFGAASQYPCYICHVKQAAAWAYDHSDPHEKYVYPNTRLGPYSLDEEHYIPLCVKCHRHFDLWSASMQQSWTVLEG